MASEMQSLHDSDIWKLIDLPNDHKPVGFSSRSKLMKRVKCGDKNPG